MTHKIISLFSVVIILGLYGCTPGRYTQASRNHSMQSDTLRWMSRQDVINMSKAGVSDSLIIGMMDATDTWFQLRPQDVINLRDAGVSEKVISAMLQQPKESSDQSESSNAVRYYSYPPYYWYDGFYPYWYNPWFSVRLGSHSFHHHGRFR